MLDCSEVRFLIREVQHLYLKKHLEDIIIPTFLSLKYFPKDIN